MHVSIHNSFYLHDMNVKELASMWENRLQSDVLTIDNVQIHINEFLLR